MLLELRRNAIHLYLPVGLNERLGSAPAPATLSLTYEVGSDVLSADADKAPFNPSSEENGEDAESRSILGSVPSSLGAQAFRGD